jgi:hypothetical protein
MKSVCLPTHTSKNLCFRYRKPVFSDNFCSLGVFFGAFLAARDRDKIPGFILLTLVALLQGFRALQGGLDPSKISGVGINFGLIAHALHADNTYSAPLYICRVALLLLPQRRGTAGNGLGTTNKYLRQTTSGAAGNGLGTTAKYLQRTTSGAANCGLGTTFKYLRGAAGIGLGTTIKSLRRTTSAAASNSLGTTIKYLGNQYARAGSNWTEAHYT